MPNPIQIENLPPVIADLVRAVAKAWDETPEAERVAAGLHVIGLHANGAVIVRRGGTAGLLGIPVRVEVDGA
jgi:hypothetical protein